MSGIFREMISRLTIEPRTDEARAAEIRAYQIRTMVQVTPLMMAANAVNATIVTLFLYPKTGSLFLPAWAFAIYVLAGAGFWQWQVQRSRPPVIRASRRGIGLVARNTLVLGLLWGSLPAVMYPGGDLETRLIVNAVSAGMLGGGCMVMTAVPAALYAWLGSISAGVVYGLWASRQPSDIPIMFLTAMFAISLGRSGYSAARNFVRSRSDSIEVREQAATIRMLLSDFSEDARDWLWETDREGILRRGQDQFHERSGFTFHSLKHGFGNPASGIAGPMIGHKALSAIWASFEAREPFKNVPFKLGTGSASRWLSISGKPVHAEDGSFSGYRGVASDITEMKLAEARIEFLAYNDALTGLVNRSNFKDALDKAMSGPSRVAFSVLYLDLDGFKAVNDNYGHHAGDRLLVEIGQRLRSKVGEKDVLARLGGDEFAVLCFSANTTQSASALAEKLIETASLPFVLDGVLLQVSMSIGIAFSGGDLLADQLLNNADLALYRAKAEGRSIFRFYNVEMDEVIKQRRLLENNLREAVRMQSLTLNFQPLVDAKTRRTTGFEALVRWYHPAHGQVPPSDFIPVAERIGLICEIGEWVIMEACEEAARWPEHLTIAVNLSPPQFADHKIVDHVKWALESSGLAPQRLELEITESLFMDNTEEVMSALSKLKSMGVAIALDDFGTGYSSLSYLLKFPFDKLKIDRAFVMSIEDDSVARDVLDAITKLGKMLELSITAEGVETVEQAALLKDMACTHLQGFHFSKPLAVPDLAAYLMKEVAGQVKAAEGRDARPAKRAGKRPVKRRTKPAA